jgi:2-haloacid dehalogenase
MTLPKWITFDAYGTLVDFALDSTAIDILGPRADTIDLDAFRERFARIRFEETAEEYRPYRDLLRHSLQRVMAEFDLEYQPSDGDALVAAVPTFGPFPDVPPVLDRLRQHCKIAIISNTDNDLIPGNLEKLGVPFDRVFTSEEIRNYKPSLKVFRYVIEELGIDRSEILHVAQGFDYDIRPAHEMGWKKIWINRRGLTGDPGYEPYEELPDLTGVPGIIGID